MEDLDFYKPSKEAEEYVSNWEPDSPDNWDDSEQYLDNYRYDVMEAFDDGRKSVLHYTKDNDFPPDILKKYLVIFDNNDYFVCFWSPQHKRFHVAANDSIVAWMELPQL